MDILNEQRGFTIIEVMVAAFILIVGILATTSFKINVIRENSNSGNYTQAATLAQDKIEELIYSNYTALSLSDTNVGNNNANDIIKFSAADADHQRIGIDEKGNVGGIYTRTWNVWDVTAKRKDIVVVVNWQTASGAIKKVKLSTVITD